MKFRVRTRILEKIIYFRGVDNHLLLIAILLVVVSGLMHAVWNLFTKQSINKTVFLWSVHLVAFFIFLPFFLFSIQNVRIDSHVFFLLISSMIFHGIYFILLAKSYTTGDLSQVYPLMRGTGAMLIPVISVFFLNEHLTAVGWSALVMINIGIFFLGSWKLSKNTPPIWTVFIALSIGLCITSYVLLDKLTLQYMSPLVLAEFHNVAYLTALLWLTIRSKQLKQEWEVNWKTILIGALLVPGGYLLFMFAMSLAQVAQLAPIREIGTVFGTLFGIFLLKEQQGLRRIVASVIMTAGVIILGLWG